jgi:PAS domain S-box-containing protein
MKKMAKPRSVAPGMLHGEKTFSGCHDVAEGNPVILTDISFQALIIFINGKVADVNEGLSKITGYDREELLDKKILAGCFNRKCVQRLFQATWPVTSNSFETNLYKKNKSVIPVEIETRVMMWNDTPLNIAGINDISARKRVEEENLKLSVALDQSANEIIITRKDANVEYVNRSFTNVTGYSSDEIKGKNPRILKSGTHPPSFYKQLWKTLLKGQQWKGEFHNRKKDGTLYWESATITPIINKNGEIIRYIAIKEDITQQKKAEASLRESEEKFRSMVSNIPGVMYRCAFDSDLTVIFISDAVRNLTGYTAEEFQQNQHMTFSRLVHPEDRLRVQESIHKGIKDHHQFNIEYKIITKQNAVKWISNNGRPAYDEKNNIKWLDGFLFDITERIMVLEELKKAKVSAEEANNAKSEFLANISHEIRTPLNSVLGFTELLESLTADSTQIKYLNSIKASGRTLMMLINDLLDLSKIESGKMTLNYTFFDIRRLLDEIRNVFSLKVAIKGIEYHEEIDRHFPVEIKFDEVRLRQILINLVGNAVKFTHDGVVSIRIKAVGGKQYKDKQRIKLEVKVIDTGIGIPEDSFKLIFESFRQHSQLDSRKYGGTGLGLAITKRLVEAMNGRIKLESQVNKGSAFTITFPGIEYSDISSGDFNPAFLSPEKFQGSEQVGLHETTEKTGKGSMKKHVIHHLIRNADYKILRNQFENNLLKKWQSFKKKQPLKEIQSFAQEMIDLGNTYKLGFISEYGQQLLSTIENFEIEEMRTKLEFFPNLIKQLKRMDHES